MNLCLNNREPIQENIVQGPQVRDNQWKFHHIDPKKRSSRCNVAGHKHGFLSFGLALTAWQVGYTKLRIEKLRCLLSLAWSK